MYIEKPWKEFNISLPKLKEALETLTPKAAGIAIGHGGALWLCFSDQLTSEEQTQIDDLYDSIDEEHEIATSYMTQAQIKAEEQADKEAKQNSAKAKLLALGLTEEEVQALIK